MREATPNLASFSRDQFTVACRQHATRSRGVPARRRAKHSTVFAAELRGAFVAHVEAHTGSVHLLGKQPATRLLQADALLELERTHGRYCAKMSMKRGRAHACRPGQHFHTDRLVVSLPDQVYRAADLRQLATGQSELPQHFATRTAQQTVEDFPFDERSHHRDVRWPVQKPEQPKKRVEQIVVQRIDRHRFRCRALVNGGWHLQQQRGERWRDQARGSIPRKAPR